MSQTRRIRRQAQREVAKAPEVMGLAHPKMTRGKALELLPDGVLVPLPLLYQLGLLCNPMEYRTLPNGVLMDLAEAVNGLLDAALRKAQEGSSAA